MRKRAREYLGDGRLSSSAGGDVAYGYHLYAERVASHEPDAVQEAPYADDGPEEDAEPLQDGQEEVDAGGLVAVVALLLDQLDEVALEPLDCTLSGLAHLWLALEHVGAVGAECAQVDEEPDREVLLVAPAVDAHELVLVLEEEAEAEAVGEVVDPGSDRVELAFLDVPAHERAPGEPVNGVLLEAGLDVVEPYVVEAVRLHSRRVVRCG